MARDGFALSCAILVSLACACKGPDKFSGARPGVRTPTPPPLDCGNVKDGGSLSRIAYTTATVPPGEKCETRMQTRECHNGVLEPEWKPPGLFETCTPEAWRDCRVGDVVVPHGSSITKENLYQAAQVAAGGTCRKVRQVGTCADGTLTWVPPDSMLYATCTVQGYQNCYVNGTFVAAHGTTQTATQQATVPVPGSTGSCLRTTQQSRSCYNGVLGNWGPAVLLQQTCTCRDDANRTRYEGEIITRTGYVSPSVPYGSQCQRITQTRTCRAGSWSAWQPAGEPYATCQVGPAPKPQPTAIPVQVCTPPSRYPAGGFSDIGSSMFRADIISAATAGLIGAASGTQFLPTQGLPRGEATLVAINVLRCLRSIVIKPSVTQAELGYPDVTPSDPYAREIEAAKRYRIAVGYNDGTFRRAASVTRAEFLTMLFQAVRTGLEANALPPDSPDFGTGNPYSDLPAAHWAYRSVTRIAGYCRVGSVVTGRLLPDIPVTRDLAAATAFRTRECLKAELSNR